MARTKLDLTQILLDYIKVPKTSYCIMITGDWGCGKTYFIDNIFADNLKSQKITCENGKNYEAVRISLFGVKSKGEITERLLSAKMPLYNKIKPFLGLVSFGVNATKTTENLLGATISSTLNTSEIVKQSKEWFTDDKHVVYIFDDFERIDTSFSSDEVFSYISQLIEKENKKVIIVCNEEKTRNDKWERYKEIKEKVVRYTYEYSPELEDVFDSICSKVAQDVDYRSQIKKYKEIILQIFKSANHNNLRTLEFIIDVYEKIWMNRPKGTNNFEEEYIQKTLTTITIYAIEIKSGRNSYDMICQLTQDPFENIDWDDFSPSQNEEEENDKNENQDQFKSIKNSYEKFKSDILSEPHYYEYIKFGYYNNEKFEESKTNLVNKLLQLKTTEEGIAFSNLINFYSFEDSEIERNISSIKGYLETYPYSYDQVIDIIQAFSTLKKLGFNINDTREDRESWVSRSVKNVDINKLEDFANSVRFNYMITNEVNEAACYILKITEEKRKNESQNKKQLFINDVTSNNAEQITERVQLNHHDYCDLGAQDFYNFIQNKSIKNKTLRALFIYLADYQKYGNNKKLLTSLSDMLDKREKTDLKIRELIIEKIHNLNNRH